MLPRKPTNDFFLSYVKSENAKEREAVAEHCRRGLKDPTLRTPANLTSDGEKQFFFEEVALMSKIESRAEELGRTPEEIYKDITTDYYAQALFQKSAKRRIHFEQLVVDYLNNFKVAPNNTIGVFTEVENLPVRGKNALYLRSGVVEKGETNKSKTRQTPSSIDIYLTYVFGGDVFKIYCSHKYTSGAGTSQKHQLMELESYLKHARESTDEDVLFVAVPDGDFYSDYSYANFKPRMTNLDHLKKFDQGDRAAVLRSSEFVSGVTPYLVEWLKSKKDRDSEIKRLLDLKTALDSQVS